MMQCINQPTRGNNILDLVFTNNLQLINQVQINDTIHSDHKIIQCDSTRLTKTEKKASNHYEKFDTLNFHSQKIEWDRINEEIDNINWDDILKDKSVSDMYETITQKHLEIAEKWVPQRKTKCKNKYKRERRNIWCKLKKAKDHIHNNKRVIHYKNEIEKLEMELTQS